MMVLRGCGGDKYYLPLFIKIKCDKLEKLVITANLLSAGIKKFEVLNMGVPSKPMAKNSNSKFTTRNSKQDIFSRIAKSSESKAEPANRTKDVSKPGADDQTHE